MRRKSIALFLHLYAYAEAVLDGVLRFGSLRPDWEFHVCPPHAPRNITEALKAWKPDGVIALIAEKELVTAFRRLRVPVINTSGAIDIPISTVRTDSVAIGRLGARHFLDRGFRNFAFFGTTQEIYSRQRERGFVDELAREGFTCDVHREPSRRQWHHEADAARLGKWLKSLPQPLALMACHDSYALCAVNACRRVGLSVPQHVAILGVDNWRTLCMASSRHISSVDGDGGRVGYEAAALLDRLMAGSPAPKAPLLVPPRGVVLRETTDVAGARDELVTAAMKFIHQNASRPLSTRDLTRELSVSRGTLDSRFRAILRRSPAMEIRLAHVELAKRLLTETARPIPEVAVQSGFSGYRVFFNVFRRIVGMPPVAYRQKAHSLVTQDSIAPQNDE